MLFNPDFKDMLVALNDAEADYLVVGAYGKDANFLDGLEDRGQNFVMEIPCNFHGWLSKPKLIIPPRKKKCGRPATRKRPRKKDISCQVNNLASYSPVFKDQNWQRYRIKDTERGLEVMGVGAIETCFRTAKEELGMDHFEVRGWRCVHRHWYVTQLSYLFCSRLRIKWDDDPEVTLSVEQVRSVVNTWLYGINLQPPDRRRMFEKEIETQRYYQKRNATAKRSHTKTRKKLYKELAIPIDKIKSCVINKETQ